jgi:hypothetical protein
LGLARRRHRGGRSAGARRGRSRDRDRRDGGPDEIDGRGWKLDLPRSRKKSLREFKVAVLLDDPHAEVDQPVQDEIQKLANFSARRRSR